MFLTDNVLFSLNKTGNESHSQDNTDIRESVRLGAREELTSLAVATSL